MYFYIYKTTNLINALGMHFPKSIETRAKMSKAHIGIVFSEEHCAAISVGKLGKCTGAANAMSKQEHRDKVAPSKIGRKALSNSLGILKLSKPR